jgi:hypothetical protein
MSLRYITKGSQLYNGERQNRNGAVAQDAKPMYVSLGMLLKARDYACDVKHGVWEFAVEIDRFRDTGLSECDLRWLCCKGYVEHAIEVTLPGQTGRNFGPVGCLKFVGRSCFVLTNEGVFFAGSMAAEAISATSVRFNCVKIHATREIDGSKPAPSWNSDQRVFRVGDTVVKHYRVPASNQELVLSVFEEEAWPKHIEDPLSPVPEIDPRRRLHSTIQCLNRNQKHHLIHFHGDGHGTGVCWELLAQNNGDANQCNTMSGEVTPSHA